MTATTAPTTRDRSTISAATPAGYEGPVLLALVLIIARGAHRLATIVAAARARRRP